MRRFKTLTVIVFALFIIILLVPAISSAITYVSLIPAVAAIATIYFGLIKYWMDSDLMFKSLFKEFNERFDALNENLNNIVADQTVKGEKTKNQIIQDYLNLCAEEYYWFSKGRIPDPVWNSWLKGIKTYLLVPEIKNLFKSELQYESSYYGFFSTIKYML